MGIIVEKLKDLAYHELITIGVIESDEDLSSIFKEDVNLTYNVVRTLSKENKLNSETKELIRGLFDSLICTKPEYIDKYLRLLNSDTLDSETTEDTIKKINVVSENKDGVLPRRYGKLNILKDIETQGGKATPTQRAMLKVNDLKNIYVNLSARGIKDMLGGSNLLSDEDCRKIVSAIKIVERQLEGILKKK